MSDAASQRKMWGARFDRDPDASFYEFERAWKFDRRLLPQEFALDRAWARAIARAGILTSEEGDQIVAALDTLEARSKSDPAWLDSSKAKDVHHFVETALIEKLGALGAKLHTGRSRNDMVATEFRMYVKDAAREIRGAIVSLERAIAEQAERNLKVPMPGTTHMQHAQPLLLSHWLLAHGEAFHRDAERVAAAAARADVFPLDRKALAHDLGFSNISANSLDAVSDRDFALEYLFALSTLAMHLSRLAEDFVLVASPEFGFVELPDEFSTGSSLMPQKKNPDAWELIRGKTGRIYASLMALFVTMKGLPSSYQRDLQEDKENLFQAHDQALAMVHIAAATLAASKFREDRLRAAAQDPALVATELADYLVTFGVPFREAHEIVGKVLRAAEQEGKSIREMSIERLKEFSPVFDRNLATALTLESALARRARRAKMSDAPAIYRLIAHYAEQGLLLSRTEDEIRRNIGHFLVQLNSNRIVGCLSLEKYNADLAEIRSVAVDPEIRGCGVGAKLLSFALQEARKKNIVRVFAVTHAPEFFERQGFVASSKNLLTEKVERDCHACPKRRSCKLVAVTATLFPERVMLPVLDESATPMSAA